MSRHFSSVRAVYGSPPMPHRGRDFAFTPLTEEERADIERESFRFLHGRQFGIALFNLLAPLCGEEPLP